MNVSGKKSRNWLQLVDDALLAHERGDMDEFSDIMEQLRMSLEWDTLTETMSPIVVEISNLDNSKDQEVEDGHYSITNPLYQLAWEEQKKGNYQSAINHLMDIMDFLDSDSENFQWDFTHANFVLGSLYFWESSNLPLTVEKQLTLRKNAEEYLITAYEFIDMWSTGGFVENSQYCLSQYADDRIQCRLRLGLIRGHFGDLTEKEKLFTEALDIVKNETIPNHEQVEMAIVTDLTWLASQGESSGEVEVVYEKAAQVMKKISNTTDGNEQEIILKAENSGLSTRGILKKYSTKNWPLYMDNIPPKKLRNALNACNRRVSEEDVMALLDTTVFGSAKNCVIFTNEGLFYREDWNTEDVGGRGPHFKLYSEIDPEFVFGGIFATRGVKLGGGSVITTGGIGLPSTELLFEVLQSICSNLQN